MILIAEFYSSTPLGMDPSTNKEAARDCARRCAAAAGGEAYLSFYQMLTGGHDD